jgi:hypothetical protein
MHLPYPQWDLPPQEQLYSCVKIVSLNTQCNDTVLLSCAEHSRHMYVETGNLYTTFGLHSVIILRHAHIGLRIPEIFFHWLSHKAGINKSAPAKLALKITYLTPEEEDGTLVWRGWTFWGQKSEMTGPEDCSVYSTVRQAIHGQLLYSYHLLHV